LIASVDAGYGTDASVVLGDFNEEAGERGREVLAQSGFANTYDRASVRCRPSFPTYTTFQPEGSSGGPRIDAIYVKGLKTQWTCVDEIIKDKLFISDHLPLHAVVSWSPERE
jgi:endonuclease/exonuclease/phosphatase family metal-dependent hydrolase